MRKVESSKCLEWLTFPKIKTKLILVTWIIQYFFHQVNWSTSLFNRNQEAVNQVYFLLLVSMHCNRSILNRIYMLTSLSLIIKDQREIDRAYAYFNVFNWIFWISLRKFWWWNTFWVMLQSRILLIFGIIRIWAIIAKKYLENSLSISQVATWIFKMFPQRFFKEFPFPTNYSLYSTQGISLGNVSGKVCYWKSWSFQYKKVLRETFVVEHIWE